MNITITITDDNDEVIARGSTTSPEIAEQILASLTKDLQEEDTF